MKIKYDKLFLLVLFIIGLITSFSYGAYFDQNNEQVILFSNIKEYLGHLPFDTRLEQEFSDAGIVEISANIERDHGISAYYPVFGIWYLNQGYSYLASTIWHVYTFLFVFFVGCCSLYFLAKDLFKSKQIATAVTLLFYFTPRIFAESHYNNKDLVLLSCVLACFFWGWRVIKKCSVVNVLLFAVYGAIAFNTKIIGAWFFGIIGLYILCYYIFTKQFNRNILGKMLLCIGTWFVVYILITPASWNNIIEFFEYILIYAVNFNRWSGSILYDGRLIHAEYTGIPHKYLPTMILFTVPVGILLSIVCGAALLVFDFFRSKFKKIFEMEGYVLMAAFAGVVPLAYAILAKTPVYNGWRHFYFVYAAMIICAGYGIYRIKGMVKNSMLYNALRCGMGAYILVLFVGIMINYPQEHSYYNWIAGDGIEDSYELDYWELSMRQACESIVKDSPDDEKVSVGALNWLTEYVVELNMNVLPDDMKVKMHIEDSWENADYVIINTTYAIMYNMTEYEYIKEQYELTDKITSYGNTICEVYKKQ